MKKYNVHISAIISIEAKTKWEATDEAFTRMQRAGVDRYCFRADEVPGEEVDRPAVLKQLEAELGIS